MRFFASLGMTGKVHKGRLLKLAFYYYIAKIAQTLSRGDFKSIRFRIGTYKAIPVPTS